MRGPPGRPWMMRPGTRDYLAGPDAFLSDASDIIALVVFWRLRYKLSLRDQPEMFFLRRTEVSHETVREWYGARHREDWR
jgi:hypothetical protein